MSPWLAAVLVVVSVLVAVPAPPAARRTARRFRRRPGSGRAVVPVVAGVGAGLVVGGPAGLVVGAVAALAVRLTLPLLETRSGRARREAIDRQAPLVIDLTAACLASGAPLDASVVAAAVAVGPPVADLLLPAVEAMRLGAETTRAWSEVASQPALAGFVRAIVRAVDSGAPLADVLPRLADRARAARRAAAEARVRAAGVRLTAPLGLAFLPAFGLLGVVPVVAAWVGELL